MNLFYFQGPRRVIGGRALNNLLLGRYHQPVREERVFLLIEFKGSTALAERLRDREAHAGADRMVKPAVRQRTRACE